MRWLKVLVIGMGVVILVGLTIVIVTVVNRANTTTSSTSSLDRPSPPVIGAPNATKDRMSTARIGDRRIAIPRGAMVEEVTSDALRLTVRLRLASGKAALLLIDAGTGEKIGLITLDESGQ